MRGVRRGRPCARLSPPGSERQHGKRRPRFARTGFRSWLGSHPHQKRVNIKNLNRSGGVDVSGRAGLTIIQVRYP